MGFSVKFNWVLQTEITDTLLVGKSYSFEKSGNRVFPINTPIDLIDSSRNAIAKIKVTAFTNEPLVTRGSFEIVKIYEGDEKAVLSNYWIENE